MFFGQHCGQPSGNTTFVSDWLWGRCKSKIRRVINLNKLIHNLTLQQIDKISNDLLIESTSKSTPNHVGTHQIQSGFT